MWFVCSFFRLDLYISYIYINSFITHSNSYIHLYISISSCICYEFVGILLFESLDVTTFKPQFVKQLCRTGFLDRAVTRFLKQFHGEIFERVSWSRLPLWFSGEPLCRTRLYVYESLKQINHVARFVKDYNMSFLWWQKKRPSALDIFDDMIVTAKGKKIVVFLDYDGTVSNIVPNPDEAFMTNKVID